jgi:NADH-quinone oxidoreductase subunit A
MSLLAVIALTTFVALFGIGLVAFASLLGPRAKQSEMKTTAYESGLPGEIGYSTKMPVKFYLTAILFILFDIEIIFMYPWAITFSDSIDAGHGLYFLSVMGIFLAIFIFGLFWEIRSRALEWE